MTKGNPAPPGTRRFSKNGYLYEKLENGKWELVHRLLMEKKLNRRLQEDEYVIFLEGCSKEDPDPDLLEVRKRGRTSLKRRIAQVEGSIQEKSALLEQLQDRLKLQESL
jgi:hypothetical protein